MNSPEKAVVPLSHVRTHGDLIFVSGQVGREADGTIPESLERQTRLAIEAVAHS